MHNHCTPLISLSVVYATEKDGYGTVMTAVCNVPSAAIPVNIAHLRSGAGVRRSLGAFVGDTENGIACLGAGRLADDVEYLLKAFDLAAGFLLVRQ